MKKWVSEPNLYVMKIRPESSKTIQFYTNLINTTSKYDLILPRLPMNLINICIKNNLTYYIKYDINNKHPIVVNKHNKNPFCKQQSKINGLDIDEIKVKTFMSKTQGKKILKKSLSF